jgi:cellulose biosynthesis protein BcsQ
MEDRGKLTEDVAVLAEGGFDYCFIDTAPGDIDNIEFAILVATAVIIPIRASFVDISAIDAIVDLCKRRRKPYAFVLNAFDKRAAFKAVNTEATAMLLGRGKLLATRIPYEVGFMAGQSRGRTGPEQDPSKLREPIDGLWAEILALISGRPAS